MIQPEPLETPPSQTCRALILAGIPGPGVAEAQSRLSSMTGELLIDGETGDLLTPHSGAESLRQQPGTHLVMLYPAPESFLVDAMQAGSEPQSARAAWKKQTEALLEACRRDRRRTTLINAQEILADTGSISRLLAERIGTPLQSVASVSDEVMPPADRLLWLLASYCLRQDQDCRALISELVASSLKPGAPAAPCIESVYETILTAREETTQVAALAAHEEVKAENELLLEQLFKVQEELENYALVNSQLRRDVDAQKLKLKSLTDERSALKDKLSEIRASRSWRITLPLRLLTKASGKRRG